MCGTALIAPVKGGSETHLLRGMWADDMMAVVRGAIIPPRALWPLPAPRTPHEDLGAGVGTLEDC